MIPNQKHVKEKVFPINAHSLIKGSSICFTEWKNSLNPINTRGNQIPIVNKNVFMQNVDCCLVN